MSVERMRGERVRRREGEEAMFPFLMLGALPLTAHLSSVLRCKDTTSPWRCEK